MQYPKSILNIRFSKFNFNHPGLGCISLSKGRLQQIIIIFGLLAQTPLPLPLLIFVPLNMLLFFITLSVNPFGRCEPQLTPPPCLGQKPDYSLSFFEASPNGSSRYSNFYLFIFQKFILDFFSNRKSRKLCKLYLP